MYVERMKGHMNESSSDETVQPLCGYFFLLLVECHLSFWLSEDPSLRTGPRARHHPTLPGVWRETYSA